MHLSRAPAPGRARIAAAALLLLSVAPRPAHADWSVNGFGFGFVQVNIWCNPNAPPAAPNAVASATGFGASVTIPPPAVPGCNPGTSGTSTNGALWNNQTTLVAAAGDWVSAPPSSVLAGMVTPTLPLSTVAVSVGAEFTGTTAIFFGTWSGTDPGDAASLEWYDVSVPTAPVLIASLLRVGPWSEPIAMTIPVPGGDPANLNLVGAAIASSITPEPASTLLVVTGLALVGAVRARRRRA